MVSPTATRNWAAIAAALYFAVLVTGKPLTLDDMRAVLEQNALTAIKERTRWLGNSHSEGAHFRDQDATKCWWQFTPYYPCLWTLEKEPSCAAIHDGGKWTCGVREVGHLRPKANPCVVLSFGSNGNTHFEEFILRRTNCVVHIFDIVASTYWTPIKLDSPDTFHLIGLSHISHDPAHTYPTLNLTEALRLVGQTHVDILKMDIEGAECGVLEHADWGALQVGQLLVEIHPEEPECIRSWGRGSTVNAGVINRWFKRLEAVGLRLMHLEPVTKSSNSQVELVFLHKDWDPTGIMFK